MYLATQVGNNNNRNAIKKLDGNNSCPAACLCYKGVLHSIIRQYIFIFVSNESFLILVNVSKPRKNVKTTCLHILLAQPYII